MLGLLPRLLGCSQADLNKPVLAARIIATSLLPDPVALCQAQQQMAAVLADLNEGKDLYPVNFLYKALEKQTLNAQFWEVAKSSLHLNNKLFMVKPGAKAKLACEYQPSEGVVRLCSLLARHLLQTADKPEHLQFLLKTVSFLLDQLPLLTCTLARLDLRPLLQGLAEKEPNNQVL